MMRKCGLSWRISAFVVYLCDVAMKLWQLIAIVMQQRHLVQVEDQRIGWHLVSLMSSNFLVPKQSTDQRLKRIIKLAISSVTATRNFFLYSKHVLEFAGAVQLMQSILLHVQDTHSRDAPSGRVKNFLFSALSSSVLGPTQPPIQWVPGAFSGGKSAGG
jgi:hypothetical protein